MYRMDVGGSGRFLQESRESCSFFPNESQYVARCVFYTFYVNRNTLILVSRYLSCEIKWISY